MDRIKRINKNELYEIASEKGFSKEILIKDYVLTEILFLLKDVSGIYFKGGTALQKTILHHSRLSEDIDFTITRKVKDVDFEITKILENSKLFGNITRGKKVDGFTRIIVSYTLFKEVKGNVFIDLNERAKLLLPNESKTIEHFYKSNIPKFSFNTLAEKELIAEKVSAAIGRNKPRDHYDIYQLIKHKKKFDMKLVKKKCEFSGVDSSITKMFANANKLYNKWDEDMLPLLSKEVSFKEVMQKLAKHFNLSKEKERSKKKN
jgi:predicted nucleotidyltransferase component of viral defense system